MFMIVMLWFDIRVQLLARRHRRQQEPQQIPGAFQILIKQAALMETGFGKSCHPPYIL